MKCVCYWWRTTSTCGAFWVKCSQPPPAIVLWSGDHARLERARPLAAATLPKPFSIVELAELLERLAREGTRQTAPAPKQDEK